MKKHLRYFILGFVLIIFSSVLIVFSLLIRPSADVTIQSTIGLPKLSTTVWGRIVYAENNQAANGIIVFVGSLGKQADINGYYAVPTTGTGSLPINFRDKTGQTYRLKDDHHQAIFIEKGINKRHDFVIEKASTE